MKKLLLSLTIAGLGISQLSQAQTLRTILYEEFTGENCGPCAATNPPLTSFIHSVGIFPTKLLLIRYQCNIPSAPGAGSLYQDDPTEEGVRQTYYTVPFAPYARWDGIVLADPSGNGNNGHAGLIIPSWNYYPNIVPDSAITNSPFAITVNHAFNSTADSLTINVTVTAAQTYSATSAGALVLQLAMEEAAVHFAVAPGTNGEKDFYDVMRKMVPNASGTALNNTWTNAQVQNLIFKVPVPAYIHDKNQIAFVAFVQDNGTKRVHQAAYSTPVTVNLDASTAAIANPVVQCSSTVTPMATIKNAGQTTLTSCLVNYQLDAGPVNTYTWSGSLTSGTSTVVTLPTISSAVGTHTLTVYTSAPNGGTDQNPSNDRKASTIIIQGAPIGVPVVEGFVGSTFPPTNWVQNDIDHTTTIWNKNSSYGGYQLSTNSAQCPFYNNSADGDHDELYIPYENPSSISNPTLYYDYAYNYYDTLGTILYDSLQVMISTNCGATWTTLLLDGGPGLTTSATPGMNSNTNGFFPTAAQWKTKTLSLSAYASSTAALVKFVGINHYGNNLYIDNVNLNSPQGIKKSQGFITSVNVYPNPATTQVNLKAILAQSDNVTISVINTLGEVVMIQSKEFTAGENDLSLATDKLASGIYTILLSSANSNFKTQVSINK